MLCWLCVTNFDVSMYAIYCTSIEGVSRPNAFQVLMSSSKRTVRPPHIKHRSNSAAARGDHAIYDKLLDVLERANLVHSYRAIY